MDSVTYIVGACMDMCPQSEVSMREKEELIHRLERRPEFQPVKEYKRSAAGTSVELVTNIRPPNVLHDTLVYLFNIVLPVGKKLDVHYFIANRLRAVQQDLFKQQCLAEAALPILEPIIRYYAWSAYWYSEEEGFDKYNHDILLLDSMKECLRLADECKFQASPDIEALYLLYGLGDQASIVRAISNPQTRRNPLIASCCRMGVYWLIGNFTKVFSLIKALPVLLAAFVSLKHLENIRRHGLMVMSSSHSCRETVTPLSALLTFGLFSDEQEAAESCSYYGIAKGNNGVIFRRNAFNISIKTRTFRRPMWIQKKFNGVCFPQLFLEGCELIG